MLPHSDSSLKSSTLLKAQQLQQAHFAMTPMRYNLLNYKNDLFKKLFETILINFIKKIIDIKKTVKNQTNTNFCAYT